MDCSLSNCEPNKSFPPLSGILSRGREELLRQSCKAVEKIESEPGRGYWRPCRKWTYGFVGRALAQVLGGEGSGSGTTQLKIIFKILGKRQFKEGCVCFASQFSGLVSVTQVQQWEQDLWSGSREGGAPELSPLFIKPRYPAVYIAPPHI